MIKTRDQRMAADIYDRVKTVSKSNDATLKQEYRTMALKLPALIRSAGLVQALAFVEARGSDGPKRLVDDLARTLGESDRSALLEESRTAGLPQYMYLSTQVLEALLWFRRAVQSQLGADDTPKKEETDATRPS